jgi:hypothetical protein
VCFLYFFGHISLDDSTPDLLIFADDLRWVLLDCTQLPCIVDFEENGPGKIVWHIADIFEIWEESARSVHINLLASSPLLFLQAMVKAMAVNDRAGIVIFWGCTWILWTWLYYILGYDVLRLAI